MLLGRSIEVRGSINERVKSEYEEEKKTLLLYSFAGKLWELIFKHFLAISNAYLTIF